MSTLVIPVASRALERVLSQVIDEWAESARVPRATYRLQFNRQFTFRDARHLVPYLHALGISHCYASPYLKARPGSAHGYDVTDHTALNPEVGTEDDFTH